MKRRLRLTPFAKIFILTIVVVGIVFLYENPEKVKEKISGQDTVKQDKFINEGNLKEQNKSKDKFDTLTFYVSKNNGIFTLKVKNKTVNINFEDTVNPADTVYFNISENNRLEGVLIVKK